MSTTTETGFEERIRFLESLEASGARLEGDGDDRWVADFGSPAAEHSHLVEAAGLLEGSRRRFVRVEGSRAGEMLDGLLTNDLETANREGRAIYSFILSAKGRPLADPRVIPLDEGSFRLDLPSVAGEAIEEHLTRYLPPRFASWSWEDGTSRLSVVGPEAPAVLSGVCDGRDVAGLPPLGTASLEVAGAMVLAVAREAIEGPGYDLYLGVSELQAVWDALGPAAEARGGGTVGRDAIEILRVERGVPAYGQDITTDNLPQETGQTDRAISFDKGCYTGQEVVVRIQHRGHVNRHLRGLQPVGSGDDDPTGLTAGSSLLQEDRSVGRVTSAVRSPRLGPIALGYVRREVEPGEEVELHPGADGEDTSRTSGPALRVRVTQLPFVEK